MFEASSFRPAWLVTTVWALCTWLAMNGSAKIGTPEFMASRKLFMPQWLRNTRTL